MNANLEYNVEVLSEHYVERFKQLMENDQIDDANAIGQEYPVSYTHLTLPTKA